MTCTDQQVVKLMKEKANYGVETAAARAGMSPKTARKYIESGELPSADKKPRHWKTHSDYFDEVWPEIKSFLENAPGLQAKTLLDWLIQKDAIRFQQSHLRTLQRRLKHWRATEGPEKAVIFSQEHIPGIQSQSDYTCMNALDITILGNPFKHLLYHFMLVFSRWETASICYSESYESLSMGFEKAVWELGGVLSDHRTDNLSAATHQSGGRRKFNEQWQSFLAHYQVKPSKNNPGQSQENGSVEKSHDLLKNAIDQRLMLRGSRDFSSISDYEGYLRQILKERNAGRQQALAQERPHLKPLPDKRFNHFSLHRSRVSPESTIRVCQATYSVPSRLISEWVKVEAYHERLEIYYGQKHIQTMERVAKGEQAIAYRHVINQLLRKPGAFAHYKYREHLFPSLLYRQAYEKLSRSHPDKGHKYYLKLLQFAATGSEEAVATAIEILISNGQLPYPDAVQGLIELPQQTTPPDVYVKAPELNEYNQLLSGEVMHVQ